MANSKAPKIAFIDAEFTGEHAYTTLVSLGIVTLDGSELYLTLNDYDQQQVTEWLSENVLNRIDFDQSVDSKEAYERLHQFLVEYSNNEPLYLVSCGLLQDYILFLELYKHGNPVSASFHALYDLPDYLNHYAAIDLNTLFRACGIDPSIDRLSFSGLGQNLERHHALDDAKIARACFLKLKDCLPVKTLIKGLSI